MEGWNGGRESVWSYRQEIIGSDVSSSSRSGTIVSTSTAYTSRATTPLSTFSMEAAMHFGSLSIHEEEEHDGSNDSMPRRWREDAVDAYMSVARRWLTELGVGWLLSVVVEVEIDRDARSWIRALDKITRTILIGRSMGPLFTLFIQETMLKMLTFVDVVVAWEPDTTQGFLPDPVMTASYNKLVTLLHLHDALCTASNKIYSTTVEIRRIWDEIAILLSENKSKVSEAIMSTMDEIRTKSMNDGDDLSSSVNPKGSSDIHKVTMSVMTYFKFLVANYIAVDTAIRGKYVPHVENQPPLDSMISEMVSCLEEKLDDISQSFLDQGLRFLFLLNNLYYIQQQQLNDVSLSSLQEGTVLVLDPTQKINSHVDSYVQVSWAPLLLSRLFNPRLVCLRKKYSPMCKFESEFEKIYTTQKQWKVPDPKLRRRLREAIIDKVIPGYTKYLDDDKATIPKFTTQELKDMLEKLFEG